MRRRWCRHDAVVAGGAAAAPPAVRRARPRTAASRDAATSLSCPLRSGQRAVRSWLRSPWASVSGVVAARSPATRRRRGRELALVAAVFATGRRERRQPASYRRNSSFDRVVDRTTQSICRPSSIASRSCRAPGIAPGSGAMSSGWISGELPPGSSGRVIARVAAGPLA